MTTPAKLHHTVGRDLPEIPAGRYTRADFAALETDGVWRKSWVCIGRDADVGAALGSYLVFRKLPTPILLVRGRDGQVRAFYNSCRHRGAPVVRDEQGRTNVLRCEFHSWCYGLDGQLLTVPDAHDFAGIDKEARGLIGIRCETWGGLLFVNYDADAAPLADWLGALPADLACVGAEQLRVVHRQNFVIECNWKTAIEAFVEIYHLETLHPGARGMIDCPANAIELMPHGHSRQAMRKRLRPDGNWNTMNGSPDIAAMPDIFRRNTISYSLFPNVIMPAEVIGLPILLFFPRGHRQCEMEFLLLGPDWADAPRPAFWDNFLEAYIKVLEEDQCNLAPMQESMDSGAFSGALVNYQERRIYWLHEAIDRMIGANRVPAELRVEPLLDDYVEELFERFAARQCGSGLVPAESMFAE